MVQALAVQFAFPFGFWMALAAAGVLAAHLVRRRARRIDVPFLPLWAATKGQMRGGFGASVARWLDLLLILLAVGAIALASAAPFRPGRPSSVRDLVLVMDGGLSARAGDRLDRLRRVAATEIERRAPNARLVVIAVADAGPQVWAGTDRARALQAIAGHAAGWTDVGWARALELGVAAGAKLKRPDFVFVTHRSWEQADDAPQRWRQRTVRVPVANAGVHALEVVRDPESGGALAELGLHGAGVLVIERVGDGTELWRGEVGPRPVRVPFGGVGEIALRVRSFDASNADGFAPDDTVYVRLPAKKTPRVMVVSDGDPSAFLIAALQAMAVVGAVAEPLERIAPAHVAEAVERADYFIFDRCAPSTRPTRPSLYLAPPPSDALPFRVGAPGPAPALFEVARAHRLLRGIEWERVRPGTARPISSGAALARAAPGVVLAAGDDWVALGFDPEAGVFASSPAFPLFLHNFVHGDAADLDRAPEFWRIDAPPPAGAPGGDAMWTIRKDNRTVRVGPRLWGAPGFWTLESARDHATQRIAVNLLKPDLDLAPATAESDPLADVGRVSIPDQPLVPHFAAAAIAALMLAWYAFWR